MKSSAIAISGKGSQFRLKLCRRYMVYLDIYAYALH